MTCLADSFVVFLAKQRQNIGASLDNAKNNSDKVILKDFLNKSTFSLNKT